MSNCLGGVSVTRASILLVVAALFASGVAKANLISNGDFEAGAASWTLTGNTLLRGPAGSPLWFGAGSAAENGALFGVFNGGDMPPVGSFLQTISTDPFELYNVEFDYGVTGVFASDTQQIVASILGADGTTVLANLTATDTNPPTALSNFSFSFVADGAQATVRFEDVATNLTTSRDGVLDNVSVTASVPEPTTLTLMGLGLAGIGYKRHRSKKVV